MTTKNTKLESQIESLIKKDEEELLFLIGSMDKLEKAAKRANVGLNKIFSHIIQLKAEMYRVEKEHGKRLARIDKNTRLLQERKKIEKEISDLEEFLDKLTKKDKKEIHIEKILKHNLEKARKKLKKIE